MAKINVAVYKIPKFCSTKNGYIIINNKTYIKKTNANFAKNLCPETTTLLILILSLSANGLYNEDCITAPTPNSKNEIIAKNWEIELTRPFISEPYDFKISRGKINPQIILTIWNPSDE